MKAVAAGSGVGAFNVALVDQALRLPYGFNFSTCTAAGVGQMLKLQLLQSALIQRVAL